MITYGLVKQIGPYARDYPSSYKVSNTETINPRYPYVSVVGNGTKSLHAQRLVSDSQKVSNPKYRPLKFVPEKNQYQISLNIYQPSGTTDFGNTFGVAGGDPVASGGPPSLMFETASKGVSSPSDGVPSIPSNVGSPVAQLEEVLARSTEASNELLRQREELVSLQQPAREIQPGVWDPETPLQFKSEAWEKLQLLIDKFRETNLRLSEQIGNQETKSEIVNEIEKVSDQYSESITELTKEFGPDLMQQLLEIQKAAIQKDLEELSEHSREVKSQIAAINTNRGPSLLSQSISTASSTSAGTSSGTSLSPRTLRFLNEQQEARDVPSAYSEFPVIPKDPVEIIMKRRLQETVPSLAGLSRLKASGAKTVRYIPYKSFTKRPSMRRKKRRVDYSGLQLSDASSGSSYMDKDL